MSRNVIRKAVSALSAVLICSMGFGLTSCFNDEDPIYEKYKEWREQNDAYLEEAQAMKNEDGTAFYTKVVPSWAPNTYVLIHWHNDRALTASNLSPMDNSTTKITYELFDIEGERLSDSFSSRDSVYTSLPSSNIIGMWAGLTHMNVGDTVTMVMPASAGYGISTMGKIKPYSTLVYNVKLKAVSAYEVP